jgi:hypothetical protein
MFSIASAAICFFIYPSSKFYIHAWAKHSEAEFLLDTSLTNILLIKSFAESDTLFIFNSIIL